MPRYTATWSLNLVPDLGEEEHESIYESAPIEIEGENFSAAAKVEQMTELDAQMPVPMDDKAGWTVLFALLHINLIPDTDALKAAARPSPPSARRLNPMNRCYSLPLALCVCLFLFIGCGSTEENQPAQLIWTVPAEGEYIDYDGLIYLYFDKLVTGVGVNYAGGDDALGYSARNRHGKSSAAAWEIEVSRLKIWPSAVGYHPEELVQIDITFRDDVGWHNERLKVQRPAIYPPPGRGLVIIGGTVTNGAKDIDPELLHTTGIQITFDDNIQGGTAVLRPKDGSPLNWIAEWGRNSVTLYPRNNDRLQNGTEYIIELIGVNDGFGEYNFEIRFTTKE